MGRIHTGDVEIMTSDESAWARIESRAIRIDGDRVVYRAAGKGSLLLLVHGMAGSSVTWRHVMPALAERFTVLAPDLLGQGGSDKPCGDYSLGAHANTLRDLMDTLGKRATSAQSASKRGRSKSLPETSQSMWGGACAARRLRRSSGRSDGAERRHAGPSRRSPRPPGPRRRASRSAGERRAVPRRGKGGARSTGRGELARAPGR